MSEQMKERLKFELDMEKFSLPVIQVTFYTIFA